MNLKDKIILITGGCGSFGTAMTERLLKTDIKEIRLFSRNEKNQWLFKKKFNDSRVKLIIGDIRDYSAIIDALKDVNYVFHAGAMKHVDKCEEQPLEAIKTNVNGSKNVILASIKNKVEKVICLSTDKSANAETCYGATKYLMEKMALNINSGDTEIIVTRYGNVLGSNGSVVPLFKELAKQNKSLTITNREMTRFFMTMNEAIDLVLYALEFGNHRDLIVYKNKSATVGMIADCISDNQVIIGTRCIEKSGEALLTVDELNHSKELDKYYIVNRNIINDYNYDKPFTSDNAERFNKEELKQIIDSI